jgi:hypothetical protein
MHLHAAAVCTPMSPRLHGSAPAAGDRFASVGLLRDPRQVIGVGRRGAGIRRQPPEPVSMQGSSKRMRMIMVVDLVVAYREEHGEWDV